MKQSLQLSIGQSLALTPQLQQAIRLLQLSTLDLNQEIQQLLESNPMLELEEPTVSELDEVDEIGEEEPTWEDTYQTKTTSKSSGEGEYSNFENYHATCHDLRDHLYWQMNLSNFSPTDFAIANTIIDAIDDDGFLTSPLEDIIHSLGPTQETVEIDEVLAVLHRIQTFDPVGVGARDLQESLLIQLDHCPESTPWLEDAKKVVREHIELLGNHDYQKLMRVTKLKEAELKELLLTIQALNPRPGSHISPLEAQYIVPDVMVRKRKGRWCVELNEETTPKLAINNTYANLIRRADNSPDNNFLRNSLQEARWFIKSLQSRNETLLKVATAIVDVQQGFFEYGEEAMKPLVLHNIAETVEMHESTISRVTTQ